MSTRAAGSVLLRHLGPRVFGPVPSPAAAPPSPLLALAGGGERSGAAVWVRLLSASAAEAKEEAAEAAKEGNGKRGKVVSSYWGVLPSKLMTKDGAEWRWSCFRVGSAPTKGRIFR